ncbi:MAK10-like protein [Tanacetum coccineum]
MTSGSSRLRLEVTASLETLEDSTKRRRDKNPIRTIGDYSRPSHEGHRNTIELPIGNNVVPMTTKLHNDILMFQQHQEESLSEAWTRFKDLLQKVPHHGIDLWLQVQIFCDHVNPATRQTIDQSVGGKLRDRNTEESWALLEDLALYDNESWNDQRDFAKSVKAISLPQDVPGTSDSHLIELKNQVQCLMEAHLAPKRFVVNKITSSCKICSGPMTLNTEWKILSKLLLIMHPRVLTKWETSDRTKSYPVEIVRDVEVHIGKLKLLNDFYIIDMKKDPETLLLVGRGFLATANTLIDCRKAKITIREGITRIMFGVKEIDLGEEEAPYWTTLSKRGSYKPRPSSDGVGAQTPYYVRKEFMNCHLLGEWEIARDAEINPFKDVLVFRRMVELLINLKGNMWESKNLIENPIQWDKATQKWR